MIGLLALACSSPNVIRGVAKNAKAGAVIVTDGDVIYVGGLSEWPEEVLDKTVEATGKLVDEKFIPDPVGETGLPQQGAEGSQSVLKEAEWKRLE